MREKRQKVDIHAHTFSVYVCLSVCEETFTWRLCLSEGFWALVVQANSVTGECQDSILTKSKSRLAYQGCQWGFVSHQSALILSLNQSVAFLQILCVPSVRPENSWGSALVISETCICSVIKIHLDQNSKSNCLQ